MFEHGAWPMLQMGLAAGLLHSFDADHMAAVAGISSQQRNERRWSFFALRWAAGHGVAVIAIALAVFLLGLAIPYRMSALAEQSVAYMLIVIGLLAWLQLYGEYRRAHSCSEKKTSVANKATAVGLLHGCAGSAPLLALLPATAMQSPAWGMTYIFIFCLGVVFTMLLLGALLAVSVSNLKQHAQRFVLLLRPLMASISLFCGCYLVFY